MLGRRRLLLEFFKLADMAIMAAAFAVAWALSDTAPRPTLDVFSDFLASGSLLNQQVSIQYLLIMVGVLFGWYLIFANLGLYHSHRLSTHRFEEAFKVLVATTFGTVLVVNVGLLFEIFQGSEGSEPLVKVNKFSLIFWGVSSLATIVFRMALRASLEWARLRGRNLRMVLIMGTNPRALEYARMLRERPELGYRVVGFMDEEWEGLDDFLKNSGEKLVTGEPGFDKLGEFLATHVVDEVFIALPARSSYQHTDTILRQCEEQGITVRFFWDIFNRALARSRVENFEGNPVVTLTAGAREGWRDVVKRGIDLVVSFLLLIILAPVFLLSAIAIKVTSKGPIFFIQERVGLNKRRFKLFKFRTMVENAEELLADLEHLNEVAGPVFKIKDDARITPIGGFLRRTSIDELPQLINVFLGSMSLVGPRPLPVRDFERFEKDEHRRRFCVRPGMTCLWQVDGRSAIPFEKWMELDMEYIDKWSLWLDFKILARTIPAVVKGSGAA